MLETLNIRDKHARRNIYFLFFVVASLLAFWFPIKQLVEFVISHDYASHILLIAPVSVFLVYLKRQNIFSVQVDPNRKKMIIAGSGLFLLGLMFLTRRQIPTPERRKAFTRDSLAGDLMDLSLCFLLWQRVVY